MSFICGLKRVDGRRGDVPFAVIDRLADFVDVATALELVGALDVAGESRRARFHRAVIPPLVGITDFVADARQFASACCFVSGLIQSRARMRCAHGVLDALHHIKRALLEFGEKTLAT